MNGIVIVDKPEGFTSHDAVAKLRGILHERRIGHGGTLDPMATGVLPVFVGRATRAAEFCENAEKEYIAGLRLGIVTDTQDTTGTVLESRPVSVTEEELIGVLSTFLGEQKQIPPMYSAVKVGGRKLYELARRGVEVERKPRDIVIKKLSLEGKTDEGDYVLDVVCSKGTYIRTLCADIGDALGCGGAMASLRRIRAGAFTAQDAVTMEEIERAAANGEAESILLPVDTLFREYPADTVTDEYDLKQVKNGGGYKTALPDGKYRIYGKSGEFLMLGAAEDGYMRTIKSFFEVEK